jgi:hypothetical protein
MIDLPKRPPIAPAPLSLILTVPPRDTEAAEALREWVTYLNGTELDYEILLVSEQAEQSVAELAAGYARVQAVPLPERHGFGSALRQGLEQARRPLLLYARCDLRYKPADLKQLLKWINDVDLVVGQRVFPNGTRRQGARAFLYRCLIRVLTGVRLHDLECPVVLARRSIFARIPIQSHGLFAHTEVLAKANFLGCYLSDAPLHYRPPTADKADASERRFWPDLRRMLAHPDFGPAVLPSETIA